MMMDCDTLLTVGSNFPYTQFLPELDQARAIQIDRSGKWIGMRYPYELNLVGDAKATLQALIPLLRAQDRPVLAGGDREQRRRLVADRRAAGADRRRPGQPDADLPRAVAAAAGQRDRRRRLGQRRELVRPAPAVPRRHARLAVRHAGHDGPGRAVRDRRQVGAPGPARDRAGRRRRDADERHGRADHRSRATGSSGPTRA